MIPTRLSRVIFLSNPKPYVFQRSSKRVMISYFSWMEEKPTQKTLYHFFSYVLKIITFSFLCILFLFFWEKHKSNLNLFFEN